MSSEKKPMTRLSMEAVFGQMPIEKIWILRKENPTIKMITESAPVDQMKKWRIDQIHIKEDQIVAYHSVPGFNSRMVKLNGTKQTKWVSPRMLILENPDFESLRKSVNPVAPTFCNNMTSIEVFVSTEKIGDEFVHAVLELLAWCEDLNAFSLHARNVEESIMMELSKWIHLKNFEREMCFLSVNASAEITPKFINNFFTPSTGPYFSGAVMIKESENGEIETDKRAAIREFFQLTNPSVRNRYMIFECMQRDTVDLVFTELEGRYNQGVSFYLNGSRVFYTRGANNAWFAQFEIRSLTM